ncbi:NADAR family protein [Undibacterium sp. Di26W]|uniref:NADAR family protein n=1 Tax=Undibacterium sp. Di26W TaxID=3413035 RepID=UPI003BF2BE02
MNINNLEELLQQLKDGKQFDYLYFWGHRKKGTATDKSCFSQWFPASFHIDGIQYATAEHYMMASKARLFNDHAILEKILATDQPDAAKHLGRKIAAYDESVWVQHRFQIVVDANYAKFLQHPALAKFLLGTGGSILVEASPVDSIWGIGLAHDHADSKDPHQWQGLNLLGFALMEVRQRLLTERHTSQ